MNRLAEQYAHVDTLIAFGSGGETALKRKSNPLLSARA